MYKLKNDPIINVINLGIKRDIDTALQNECWRAAVILIYAGIDAMAFLDMQVGKHEVTRNDFISWVEKYIKLPGNEIAGIEFYAARCSIMHTYGAHSSLTRSTKSRVIGYMDKSKPEVRYNPAVSKELVLISIPALRDAFFVGIDKFLIEAFSDNKKAKVIEQRLKESVFFTFPAKKPE